MLECAAAMIAPRISSRRMVGRDSELQLLHDARRALSGRRGSLVLVGGEAGIGKTRLLAEFTATLRGGRAPLRARGEALEDAPRPFGPFRSVLESLIGAAPRVLDGVQPVVRRALGALVPDALTAVGLEPTLEPVEKAELFTGVTRFFEALAEKRAIVAVFEDLHWADSATLELLCHLAPRIGGIRVLLVGSYRDDDIRPAHRLFAPLARLLREHTVRSMKLEPLADRDVRSLIDDALGDSFELSPLRLREVVDACDGNPFFVEEMLKHSIEIERSGLEAPMPLSIRGLSLQRVSRLNVADRRLLDYAAVLGHDIDPTILAAATGNPTDQSIRGLRRIRNLGVLLEDSRASGELRFRHALVRQIIYAELTSETARKMHARIVEILESESEPDIHALAYHAWRADLRDRTLEYGERAGDAALVVRAAAQAATYFERSLELAADDVTRIRLLGKSGEAWLQQGEFSRAVAAFLAQHELLLARSDYDAASRALTRAAAEEANSGRIREALERLIAYQATHAPNLPREAADHVNANLARIATAGEDFNLAARSLAQISDPQQLDVFTHQVYWLARLFISEHALDVPEWRRAADALRRRNPETYPLMRSQMLHSIASTSILLAQNDIGERAADEAIAMDGEFGFFRPLAYANAVKACILGVRGRLAEARSCIDAALEESELFVVRIELALGASAVALAFGDDDLAQRLLKKEVEDTIREAGTAAVALFRGMRAAMLFAQGRKTEADRLLDEALAAPQHPFAVVHFWPLALQHATPAQVSKLLEFCAAVAAQPNACVAQACLALLSGDYATAAKLYRELGWPLHEALALERSGEKGAALEIFRGCGSLRNVRAAKGQLSAREREVAKMVASGLTNRRIAERLDIREKTIEKHVSSIFAKLNFSTRTQLAAHVARQSEL